MRLKQYTDTIVSMTTSLQVTILYDEKKPEVAKKIIKESYKEADRIINIISAWQNNTELYKVNSNAGIAPVTVCDELYYLVKRANRISDMTEGLFDVTFASLDKIWYFDKPIDKLPDETTIKNSVKNINYRFIELDEKNKTIYIRNKGTKIELGAIGKGYVVNKMKLKLQELGINNGIVNAGGDLVAWGKNESGEPWKIGVTDPNNTKKYLGWFRVDNSAVATSGSYERFALINGEKYSHIIHPKTGWPVKGIQSVTILSPDVEMCDSIATSVFLLGKDEGLAFVNQFDDLQCLIIDDKGDYYFSDNFKKN
ncbi:FAD:protein FMN transferase [Polluticaenibacter yanchengensis]|uniref:FAD:protein FMN transferase n=1 Tax=Polluticaenibacter yanchengensis TaxID=3014562 RepID=A0ABT4UN33_9BACT|nr:FAD:protein FMN transferase [Chitinophagaceae bacterium LY-5]